MQRAEDYQNERLDHLGIVAGVCQELGLAQWLDALEPNQQRVVSYGTSTGLCCKNGRYCQLDGVAKHGAKITS
ncbi:hypothetical protein KSD_97420 [Ktedonobacter sp. SOSP1-85]|uniref:DUF4277 domain-containing protein n=1 Tax=Ktedonobacter sp. SOSP1-85 TaxID=2778367 RepID=UPI0019157B18|nr:DUF4277 domain-containing protein [Ktedonobacter sp. SOSP1-85]GHO79651.1 hypothetical protein KSD_74220 [Ktedonobacter sp. SOSP1-85]GHO81971.1 hypothetical protein KSD_97420 [Ktedonobacter sp. SOSP1-85]